MVILLHLHNRRSLKSLSASPLNPVVFTVLLLAGLPAAWTAGAGATPAITPEQCLAQLDATVALATNEPDSQAQLKKQFAQLEKRCDGVPQLAHNQGVLAARAGQWPDAIQHFERSLAIDTRAAMTHRHLQQIFEHRAAQAYARALNTAPNAKEPELMLQGSVHNNPAPAVAVSNRGKLHTISTLEYELYAWWQALHNTIGLKEHYIDEFPAAAIWLSRQKFARLEWPDMHREIAFTQNDAVVIVSDAFHNRTLLLLRLIGNRWKIYQETAL